MLGKDDGGIRSLAGPKAEKCNAACGSRCWLRSLGEAAERLICLRASMGTGRLIFHGHPVLRADAVMCVRRNNIMNLRIVNEAGATLAAPFLYVRNGTVIDFQIGISTKLLYCPASCNRGMVTANKRGISR